VGSIRPEDISADGFVLSGRISGRKRHSFVDKFKSYDSLLFCGYPHLNVDHQKFFSSEKPYINGLEGFWNWAKERLMKHHRVSKEHFHRYWKELDFRYNNRNSDIFDEVANYSCDSVPKRD
jgi:transposase-like protein